MRKKLNLIGISILIAFFCLGAQSLYAQEYQWTFMVYMTADNDSDTARADFFELSEVGSGDSVTIVAIVGNTDTQTAKYGIVNKDDDFLIEWGEIIGEIDMGDTQTLVDFIEWATNGETGYPASNYALILWNASELYDSENEVLSVKELRESLEYLYSQEIIPGINLIGFDTDLMGMLETAYEIKNYADVMVASEKNQPLGTWPYDTILQDLTDTPLMTPFEFGYAIVTRYGESYEADNTLSAVRLQEQEEERFTVERGTIEEINAGGVDVTGGVEDVANAVSQFAQIVLEEEHDDWDKIFLAQQRAGWYLPSSNHDLKSFMQGVVDYAESDAIISAALDVIDAFDNCLIANYSSCPEKDNGLSIYFPMWAYESVDEDYNETNLQFLYDDIEENYTQYWDDFLLEYVDTELVPNHSGEWTYSRTVSGGTTASSYVMISSPVLPGGLDDMDPLAILKDDLGDYNRDIWRLFRWNSMLNPADYEEYPFPKSVVEEEDLEDLFLGSSYVIPGKGYWLISRNTVNIDVTGMLWPTNMPYFIFLRPGWNQIGTPFDFDIDFDTVWVFGFEGGEKGEETQTRTSIDEGYIIDLPYTFDATSDENTLTSRTLWRYANGNYAGSPVMIPGEGYWIYNKKDSNWIVFLLVNPIRSTIYDIYRDSLERTLTIWGKFNEQTPPPPPGGMDPESEDEGSSGGGSGCFIATACFGSPMAGEVNILRNFRDEYLLSNPIGQFFVSTYYRYSPKVADFIAKHNFLKTAVRAGLYPIVKACPHTN
ncbi:MAG: clostripain-related cysteine peptidase [Candidatus Ratteibacteria bacterium]|nr:clostripain-related cysteine peptidase [Candidatus Ratteibacteria bacterium]